MVKARLHPAPEATPGVHAAKGRAGERGLADMEVVHRSGGAGPVAPAYATLACTLAVMAGRARLVFVALAASLALAACSSSAKPAGSAATSAVPSSVPTSSSAAGGAQKVTLSPSTGLGSPATLHVTASGFSPNEPLVVTECANKGNSTGPGDCDLQGVKSVTSNSSGDVDTTITVVKGPFGTNHITCGPGQACLVSVSQATATPTQEADAPITFK